MARFFLIILFLIVGATVILFEVRQNYSLPKPTPVPTHTQKSSPSATPIVITKPEGLVLYDVPFVSQAPTGNWDDPRQQDGCEEAASYMAVLWARGEKPPATLSETERKLLEISNWEELSYGNYRDTSVKDTFERIFKGYFKYEEANVRYDITSEDIKNELYAGSIIIVPADGKKLGNPYFTPPGPERHNLVIRGYDPTNGEFITNDNGTKRGEAYRYKSDVLISAIRDYPTGDRNPITEIRRAMIVVRK